ncbi:uncharacterized protein LOC128089687 [Tympanuchus pallidicinctus]|uniref:uncharacterized protein LOC128089687 n=1 Tax=Tympanuchus pallidicinctus TaxID=109042 RepID=UPI002287428B|nr:uncharacterized protein LOC128089687 [Tympanuchus pallidicinctus]
MNFFDDCVLQVDATGNMLPVLLGDSEMMNMIAFSGKNYFTRSSEDGCVILPRIQVEGSTTCQDTVFMKPRRQSQPWNEGARRVSVYDPVMLARQRASKVVVLEKRRKEQEKKQQRVKFRFLPQLEETYAEVLQKAAHQAKPAASTQQTSRMAARLKHAQTEARRLQVLMASKRKEVEADIQSEYEQYTQRLSTERSQVQCALTALRERAFPPAPREGSSSRLLDKAAWLWPPGKEASSVCPLPCKLPCSQEHRAKAAAGWAQARED